VTDIQIKRVYEQPAPTDGYRVLVDRIWPRGLSKEQAALDQWARDLAPSTALRKWFAHDPARWQEFQKRYRAELADRTHELDELLRRARKGRLTLVYGARDTSHNQAQVLKQILESQRGTGTRGTGTK